MKGKKFLVFFSFLSILIGLCLYLPLLREKILDLAVVSVGSSGQDLLLTLGVFFIGVGGIFLLCGIYFFRVRKAIKRLLVWQKNISRKKWLFYLIVIAFVVRLIWVVCVPVVQFSDFALYDTMAQQITRGEGYHIEGKPTAIWSVGYPVFLAGIYQVCGHSQCVVRIVQCGLGALLTLFVFLLALEASGKEDIAKISALFCAFYPPLFFLPGLLAAENLFLPLFFGGLWAFGVAFKRDRGLNWLVMSGIFMGTACLARNGILLVPPLLALWFVLWVKGKEQVLKRIFLSIIYLLVFGAVMFPWVYRNKQVFGSWGVIGTSFGRGFYDINSPRPFKEKMAVVDELLKKNDEYQVHRILLKRGYQEIIQDKKTFIQYVLGWKFPQYLWGSEEWLPIYTLRRVQNINPRVKNVLFYVMLVGASLAYYIVVLLALVGIFRAWRQNKLNILFLLLIIYNASFTLFIKGLPRYRLPVIPLYIYFAAIGLTALMGRTRLRKKNTVLIKNSGGDPDESK